MTPDQLPEPTPGRYAVVMSHCRYEHDGYGWRSTYGTYSHSWQAILDSCCDFTIEKIKP